MITIRAKTIFLSACVAEATALLVAQTLGSMPLLLVVLGCFLALVVWATLQNLALPVMLFFLPFSPLLKLQPGTISFFTIALLAVYAIYAVTGSRRVPILHMIPGLCLVAMTLLVKTLWGYSVDNTYLLSAVTLMLIPFLVRELDDRYNFYWLTLFFTVGIVLAAVSAQYLTVFPTISRYISINTTLGMIRRSGYFGDPNFYSAHITAALSGVLILFLKNDQKKKLVMLSLMALLLIYCGLQSVSKSFLLICVCLLLLWLADLLFRKGRISVKVTLVLILLVGGMFVLSSTVFIDMLDEVFGRFSQVANLSDLTTGRTDLWVDYFEAMAEKPAIWFFGQGYTDVTVGGEASHNTVVQSLFQFGLVGCGILAAWAVCFMRTLLTGVKMPWSQMPRVAIVLLGVIGPWLALDYLFFDEIFLMPVFIGMALRFLAQEDEAARPLI